MMPEEAAKRLREPFPPEAIGKLPRANIMLDYVGHADVTDRLLEVDPDWTWEPLAYAEDGGPLIRNDGKVATLWIRLTVCGVTRPGVGNEPASKFDLEKQLISDALRNAAMRFGVALDLWKKHDLDDRPGVRAPAPDRPPVGVDEATGEVRPLTNDEIGSMKPRELYIALEARKLEAGGTTNEMRDRLHAWSQSSGADGPTPQSGENRVGETLVPAPSAPVSEPAAGGSSPELAMPRESMAPGGGPEVVEGAGTGDGPAQGQAEATALTLEGSPSATNYDEWQRLDLIAECAVRTIEHPDNATKRTLVEKLRGWDRTYTPDWGDHNEPF
jgi:hypothetical protein